MLHKIDATITRPLAFNTSSTSPIAWGSVCPGDAQHFRLPPSSGTDRSLAPGDWPQPDVLETLAIAQHHGVPTRLLDITHNALVAAFFAADDARDHTQFRDVPRLMVTAPRELAMDVLDLLDREFYNRAGIMPRTTTS